MGVTDTSLRHRCAVRLAGDNGTVAAVLTTVRYFNISMFALLSRRSAYAFANEPCGSP